MKYRLNPSGGKGDRPRDVDKKKYDDTCKRLFGNHCRLNHKHTEECKNADGQPTT